MCEQNVSISMPGPRAKLRGVTPPEDEMSMEEIRKSLDFMSAEIAKVAVGYSNRKLWI